MPSSPGCLGVLLLCLQGLSDLFGLPRPAKVAIPKEALWITVGYKNGYGGTPNSDDDGYLWGYSLIFIGIPPTNNGCLEFIHPGLIFAKYCGTTKYLVPRCAKYLWSQVQWHVLLALVLLASLSCGFLLETHIPKKSQCPCQPWLWVHQIGLANDVFWKVQISLSPASAFCFML